MSTQWKTHFPIKNIHILQSALTSFPPTFFVPNTWCWSFPPRAHLQCHLLGRVPGSVAPSLPAVPPSYHRLSKSQRLCHHYSAPFVAVRVGEDFCCFNSNPSTQFLGHKSPKKKCQKKCLLSQNRPHSNLSKQKKHWLQLDSPCTCRKRYFLTRSLWSAWAASACFQNSISDGAEPPTNAPSAPRHIPAIDVGPLLCKDDLFLQGAELWAPHLQLMQTYSYKYDIMIF